MQKSPSAALSGLGGLIGATMALLGILLGTSVANMTGGDHTETHHEEPATEH